MKKLILSILFIAFVFASIGQNLKGYYVEALTKLEAKRAFVIDLDTFYATTQLSGIDTILATKEYVKSVDSEKVTGAASSTDNAIVRFDGTTGKIIQNSGVTIDDAGKITTASSSSTTYNDMLNIRKLYTSNVNWLSFTHTTISAHRIGIQYNDAGHSLSIYSGTSGTSPSSPGTLGFRQFTSGNVGIYTNNDNLTDKLQVNGSILGTTAKLTNLTDNYIPKQTSDAIGLENSNIFFSGNIARYGTANTFSNDRDIVDKAYVDAIAAGNMPKLPVDAATTGNITLSGTQTIDGYTAGVGARILVWKQTTTSQNGVYIVASGAWTRATDLDTWAELYKAYVTVLNGAQSGSSFVCTVPSTGTLGTDPVTWILYNAPTNITVSAPLAKSGNNISLGYDTNTLDVASNLLKVKDNVYQPLLNGTGFVKASGTTITYDNSTYLTTETDPIFAADSANLLHWSDTLNLTKGIASQYDLTTGLATKQNTLTTGNLTENITGLQFDDTRQVIGGSAQLSLTSGYVIPTTTEQTNWNTAYTDRMKWDGGATGLVAATGRTSLGGTTIGQSVFTSTNPSAIRFLRANADNTVSWLDAATFRTAIGAGTGSGTVTSVATGLGLSGGTITTSGTLSVDTASTVILSRQRAVNTYQPKGTYQTGTESYISNLSLSGNTLTSTGVGSAFNSTVGNIANTTSANTFNQNQTVTSTSTANGFRVQDAGSLLLSTVGTDYGLFYMRDGHPYFINGDFGSTEIQLDAGSGTVTSVGLTVPTGFNVTGSPVTTSGTLGLTFASGYSLPTTASQTNWNTAYNDKVNSLDVTGTTTKTITLTQQDGGTVTGNFTDNDTYTSLVSNGGLGASGSSLYLSNINASGTAPLLTDYMWASPSASTTVKSFTLQTLKDLIGSSSYTLPLAANGTRGGIQIGYTSTANNFALQLSSEKAYTALPDATTSVKGIASFNSSNFSLSSGAVSIATSGIGAMNLANSVISGQVDIGSDIVDTDEFLISDAGTLRRMDASRLKTYIGSSQWTNDASGIYYTSSVGIGGQPINSAYKLTVNGLSYFQDNINMVDNSIMYVGSMSLKELGTMSTASSGYGVLWSGTDNTPHFTNDQGTNFDLSNVVEPLRTISSTGTTQLSATDKIILVTATGVTITYPTVTSGKVYTIRNTTGSAITVPTYTVLGPSSSTTVGNYQCITVVYNGSAWYQLD